MSTSMPTAQFDELNAMLQVNRAALAAITEAATSRATRSLPTNARMEELNAINDAVVEWGVDRIVDGVQVGIAIDTAIDAGVDWGVDRAGDVASAGFGWGVEQTVNIAGGIADTADFAGDVAVDVGGVVVGGIADGAGAIVDGAAKLDPRNWF